MANFEKNIKDEYTDLRTGEVKEFSFTDNLTASQIYLFVSTVSDNVVNDTLYIDPLKKLFFDYTLIAIFTDIDIESLTESKTFIDSINAIEAFLENTNVVAIIKEHMVDGLEDMLLSAVDDNIEYKTGVHKRNLEASLESLIHSVEKKINGIDMDEFIEIARNLNSVSDGLTPEKIVEAYGLSDLFKEVHNESNNESNIREVKKG